MVGPALSGKAAGDTPPPQAGESEGEGEATPLRALRVSLCRLEKTPPRVGAPWRQRDP